MSEDNANVGKDLSAIDEAPARRHRTPTLASALRQAKAAGAVVTGAVIEAGKITLEFGEPEASSGLNEWDQVLHRDAH
jgi:hypothetical protein